MLKLNITQQTPYKLKTAFSFPSSGGSSNYEELTNKPKINNVELVGNKTTSDLGIEIPTKTSDLTNDSGFITNSYHDSTKQDVITSSTDLSVNELTTADNLTVNGDETNINGKLFVKSGAVEMTGGTVTIGSTNIGYAQADTFVYRENGSTEPAEYVNVKDQIDSKQDIIQYSTMPTASSTNVNDIVEYTGTTDSTYTNGYFYKNVNTQIQESITAEETDNLGLLSNINVNSTTFKSKVNGGGTYVFVKKGYPTKLTYMNLNTMTTYSVTRDTIFDNATLGIYSWVDDSNNYYITNTLRPNAGTKLYTYDINTEETTDTGASYLNSSEPSTTSGYWTIQTSASVYEDADLSEYGITMATTGFPGNEITVIYIEASNTYAWVQLNTQPLGLTNITGYDSTKTQILKNINGVFTWVDE